MRIVKSKVSAAAALLLLLLAAPHPHAAPTDPPKLAVIIVVDQMRADYVDRFQRDWTAGLKRLVTQGAWFRRAAYPYLSTFTCAGHATISTGAFPHTHGIIQNVWWNRESGRQMTCTEDPRVGDVAYGPAAKGGDSAYRLQVPTFTDQMRTERGAHVVSLALKDRSAIMLAGHGGDAVTWASETVDSWLTSSVFATGPVPAVASYVKAHPMTADFGKTWTRLLKPARYTTADDGLGEAPPAGWTKTFPHPLTGTTGQADGSFYAQWERSPFADAYIGRFAAALVDAFSLGRHDATDVLTISFSSPDLVGHAFGPDSQEIQDMYAHLDHVVGDLFDHLDEAVGRGKWVVALTADHGVEKIPEQARADGKDAGRINTSALLTALRERLASELGEGRHVALDASNDLYFEPGIYEKLQESPKLMSAAIEAILGTPGIAKVYRSEEVRGAASSSDPLLRAAALSYFPGRSGDLILVPKPGWMFSPSGTTHGSATPDDQRVPILLMGPGIKPGKYNDAATPADIAPTLGKLCGITLAHAEGHPLTSAF